MRRLILPLLVFTAATILGCEKPPPAAKPAPPAPVTVTTAAKKTVPVQIRTIGTVKVLATVAVRPRVGGQLTEVHFREGEFVEKDQKLFTLDPRTYDAAVKQAEATLGKSQAVLRGAERNLARLERSGGGGAVADAELDAARTAVATGKAAVAVDEAAVASAQLQQSFTTIVSPLAGRVGELLVNEGNLVEANSTTPLVVVNQVSPIAVSFALPEPQLPAVSAARGKKPLKVEAYLRDGQPPIPGVLAFVDNAVNTGSGTMMLKAEFPNTDRALWPGQFVDVVLTVGELPDRVVVPATAVQSGQKGTFVFLVSPDSKAEMRPVTVAFEVNGEAVVTDGLTGGEKVVTDGQLRLISGTPVDTKAGETAQGAE